MCLKWLLKKIFRKVVHNKCIYVHDKIISYKTLYKNQQAMYKIIYLSLWQQILATTISNHNTCDRSSSHGRACSGTSWGQLGETGLCIPINLYYISMLASSANIPDNIKWANTTANTWALRAVSLLAEPYKLKHQPSPPGHMTRGRYMLKTLRPTSAFNDVFLDQSLVCSFWLQSVDF